jgi:hypothetical protein
VKQETIIIKIYSFILFHTIFVHSFRTLSELFQDSFKALKKDFAQMKRKFVQEETQQEEKRGEPHAQKPILQENIPKSVTAHDAQQALHYKVDSRLFYTKPKGDRRDRMNAFLCAYTNGRINLENICKWLCHGKLVIAGGMADFCYRYVFADRSHPIEIRDTYWYVTNESEHSDADFFTTQSCDHSRGTLPCCIKKTKPLIALFLENFRNTECVFSWSDSAITVHPCSFGGEQRRFQIIFGANRTAGETLDTFDLPPAMIGIDFKGRFFMRQEYLQTSMKKPLILSKNEKGIFCGENVQPTSADRVIKCEARGYQFDTGNDELAGELWEELSASRQRRTAALSWHPDFIGPIPWSIFNSVYVNDSDRDMLDRVRRVLHCEASSDIDTCLREFPFVPRCSAMFDRYSQFDVTTENQSYFSSRVSSDLLEVLPVVDVVSLVRDYLGFLWGTDVYAIADPRLDCMNSIVVVFPKSLKPWKSYKVSSTLLTRNQCESYLLEFCFPPTDATAHGIAEFEQDVARELNWIKDADNWKIEPTFYKRYAQKIYLSAKLHEEPVDPEINLNTPESKTDTNDTPSSVTSGVTSSVTPDADVLKTETPKPPDFRTLSIDSIFVSMNTKTLRLCLSVV